MMEREEYPVLFVSLMTVVLVLEIVLGLVFNMSVLLVSHGRLVKGADRGNTFLACLSVVDMLACLSSLPLTLASVRLTRYHDDILFCLFSESTVAFSSTASSLTLLFVSLERYHAITRPASPGMFTSKPIHFLSIVVCLSAFAFSSPFFLYKFYLKTASDVTCANATSIPEYLGTLTESSLGVSPNASTGTRCVENTVDSEGYAKEVLSCNRILGAINSIHVYELVYVTSFCATAAAMCMFYVSILRVIRRRVATKVAMANRMKTIAISSAFLQPYASESASYLDTPAVPAVVDRCAAGAVGADLLHCGSQSLHSNNNSDLPGSVTQSPHSSNNSNVPGSVTQSPHSSNNSNVPGSVTQSPHSNYKTDKQNKNVDVLNRNTSESTTVQNLTAHLQLPGQILQPPINVPVLDSGERYNKQTNRFLEQQKRPLPSQQRERRELSTLPVPNIKQERRLLYISLGIVFSFLLCWGPHSMLTIAEIFVTENLRLEAIHSTSLVLAYLTVVIHPLIYTFSRKKFREAMAKPWRRFRERLRTKIARVEGQSVRS